MKLPRWFHMLGSPPYVYRLADRLCPWLGGLGLTLLVIGAYWGLVIAPPDFQQGEAYRIVYIHPQTAYIGMMSYVVMAVAAAIGYVWRLKLAHAVAVSAAPIGAWFTFCALFTGALWGKPTWGTYWQWGDPRIMFEALLLFLFLGYLALRGAFDDRDKADRVTAILAVVGVVNIPIVHFSVEWWNSLHQGPTITRGAMASEMLVPFLIMVAAFTLTFYWLLLRRLQAEIIEREGDARWIRELVGEGAL
jgi:heme exporter protein C